MHLVDLGLKEVDLAWDDQKLFDLHPVYFLSGFPKYALESTQLN